MSIENKIVLRNLEAKTLAAKAEDPVLKWLIALVENGEMTLQVTLNIQGAILSGNLISQKEYGEMLAQYLGKTSGTKATKKKGFIHGVKIPDFNLYATGEEGYLHLSHVKIHYSTADTAVFEEETLWRGKVSSVDGFTVGLFSSYP